MRPGFTSAAAAIAVLIAAGPAPAQRSGAPERPAVSLTAWGGVSIREGQSSFRFADDLRLAGVRVGLTRFAAHPWIQADRFVRPDLVCPDVGDCAADGFLLRAGGTLPLTDDETETGVHPRLVAGIGLSRAEEETRFSYLLGMGLVWVLHPRVAPIFEARWERVPALRNIVMLNAGLSVGLF